MNIILLSGGSGKRLWPLSNDIRSKQFIKIFKTGDGYESMVQRVYRQITEVDRGANVTIATSKTQVSAIHNQLGDAVGVCVEPCRRDTFPAIALASAYLRDVKGVSPEEPVVVCPVDPYVNNDYFEALKELARLAAEGNASLTLMGIEPTYPSEKYGYIIPESAGTVSPVKTFKEKPDAKTAAEYIARGTAAFLPTSWGMCWAAPMNCSTSPITRICTSGMIPCPRSASITLWSKRNPRSRSCVLPASGRIWGPGTP